jgi:hypothetical protein
VLRSQANSQKDDIAEVLGAPSAPALRTPRGAYQAQAVVPAFHEVKEGGADEPERDHAKERVEKVVRVRDHVLAPARALEERHLARQIRLRVRRVLNALLLCFVLRAPRILARLGLGGEVADDLRGAG